MKTSIPFKLSFLDFLQEISPFLFQPFIFLIFLVPLVPHQLNGQSKEKSGEEYPQLKSVTQCAQHGWCRHEVNITNYSNCTVQIWCEETGCGNPVMQNLGPGQTGGFIPSSYQARILVAYGGQYVQDFGYLHADGHCYTYNFHYNPSVDPCSPSCTAPESTAHVTNADCGQHNGRIDLNAYGGGANHHYYAMAGGNWDGPYDTYYFSNLDAGTYTVYISSNPHEASCQRSYNITVPENDCGPSCTAPESTAHVTNADCGQHNGRIDLNAYGGGANHHYYAMAGGNWDGPYDTYYFSNLDAGTYTVYISSNPHEASCQRSYDITVPENDCGPTCSKPDATYHVTDADCGQHNGRIDIDGFGGGVNHHYYALAGGSWDGPFDTYYFSNLSEGNYTVYVAADPHEASCIKTFHIEVSSGSIHVNAGLDETICEGESAQLCASGANSYLWSTGATSQCITVSPMITTNYSVTGTSGDCTDTDHIKVSVEFCGPGTCNVSLGPDIDLCVGVLTCETLSLTGLNPSNDALNEVNNGNVMIGDARLTINQSFNGTSVLDENEITSAQTSGELGISSGVTHQSESNADGGASNAMVNQYNFDVPVCNLQIEIWDIDRNDEMVLTASGPNGPVSYTVLQSGASVSLDGDTFTSLAGPDNYPGDGSSTLGKFTVRFDDCVTQIQTLYYDIADDEGTGGSYTIVFDEGCTEFSSPNQNELCEILDLSTLNQLNDAVNEVNSGNVMIGNATLTIAQSFSGTSVLDENEITSAQTIGDVGISSGVSHQSESNADGGVANAMVNQYNFDVAVCDLEIEIWDIDRNDEMVLTASGPNGVVNYTVVQSGASVSVNGDTFTSLAGSDNYPGDGSSTLGRFTVRFDDCVTQIQTLYYDVADDEGNGGSYTIVFNEGCTESASGSIATLTPNFSSDPSCDPASLSYLWSTGSTAPTIDVTDAGLYSVTITDCTGCVATDEIEVSVGAESGTLTLDGPSPVTVCNEENIMISATPDGNAILPEGFETIYVLTEGAGLVIIDVNGTPEFSVSGPADYTIHTLVYDPNTLDLSIVEFGVTTGFDVNGLLIQGGGDICASLDVAGAPVSIDVEDPDSGTLTADASQVNVCQSDMATISATADGNENVPTGYEILYVLTEGPGLVIVDANETPEFTVEPGEYTIHTLVYDPSSLDLSIIQFGVTTGFDVNSLLVQGGGDICASLDVAGAPITVMSEDPQSGTLTLFGDSPVVVCGEDMADIRAIPDGNENVPAGYEVIYVLTEGVELVITNVNASPEFTVPAPGEYTIHTLVYDPSTLDLSIINLGVTTGFDVNGLLAQGGGEICASLDVAGAPVIIETLALGDAGLIAEGSADDCLIPGQSVTRNATLTGQVIPEGDSLVVILVDSNGNIVDVNAEPEFTISIEGDYTLHPVVYSPTACDIYTLTTVVEILDCDCVAINLEGQAVFVEECCEARAGGLGNGNIDGCSDPAAGLTATFTADPVGLVVPPGYSVLYLLTDANSNVVLNTSMMSEFEISEAGNYTMHTLVYDPTTLDLSTLVIGVNPIIDYNMEINSQGACASIDLFGITLEVLMCNNLVDCQENLYVPGLGSPVDPGVYESSKNISSDGMIMNGQVTYSAGETVDLMSGFEVMSGQEFDALIEGCDPNE